MKSFTHDELIARDMVNLDMTWLRNDSLEDVDNLPAPIIAREVVEDLTAALAEFEAVPLHSRSGHRDPPNDGSGCRDSAHWDLVTDDRTVFVVRS